MVWPTAAVSTTALDAGTDTPPRAEFLSWAQKFNQLIAHVSEYMQGLLASADAATARTALDVYSKSQVDSAVQSSTPSGAVAFFARNSAPTGWLKANGAAVSRTAYASLFAAIGTTFGAGDGATTFNLPDMRGEFPRAWDDSRGVDAGRVFGSAQAGQNASHSHTASMTSAGEHSHAILRGANTNGGGYNVHTANAAYDGSGFTQSAGSHSHTVTVNDSGGSEARPRNVALLACIKF